MHDLVRYRMLALDIDGTLLDPFGALTPAARTAIAAARQRGLRVVLCTGRRFRTAIPFARELGLSGEIVVNNGAIVKNIESGATIQHAYLPMNHYSTILTLIRRRGSPLVYIDTYHEHIDFLIERSSEAHPFQQEYLENNGEHFRTLDSLDDLDRSDVIMVSTMADDSTLRDLLEEARSDFGGRIRNHTLINKNYRGGILEFLSPNSGKWHALSRVAATANIDPVQIIAVGDDANDIEMLQHAGHGIAMGNATDLVKESADSVVRSNAEGGVVEAIEHALLLNS